jgi:hypothetical protein
VNEDRIVKKVVNMKIKGKSPKTEIKIKMGTSSCRQKE